jgi:hypothetical protein
MQTNYNTIGRSQSLTAFTDCGTYASTLILHSLTPRNTDSFFVNGDKYIYYHPTGERIHKEEYSNIGIFYPESNTIEWSHKGGLNWKVSAEGYITPTTPAAIPQHSGINAN